MRCSLTYPIFFISTRVLLDCSIFDLVWQSCAHIYVSTWRMCAVCNSKLGDEMWPLFCSFCSFAKNWNGQSKCACVPTKMFAFEHFEGVRRYASVCFCVTWGAWSWGRCNWETCLSSHTLRKRSSDRPLAQAISSHCLLLITIGWCVHSLWDCDLKTHAFSWDVVWAHTTVSCDEYHILVVGETIQHTFLRDDISRVHPSWCDSGSAAEQQPYICFPFIAHVWCDCSR